MKTRNKKLKKRRKFQKYGKPEMLLKKKIKRFKDPCPNYPINNPLKVKQTKHHIQRFITGDLLRTI